MRKILTATVAALTLGGAMVATAAPAEARPYHGGYYGGRGYYGGGHRYYGHHGSNAGAAVAAGVVGLALGAALASPGPYYGSGYYRGGYGYPAYGYGYPASGYGYPAYGYPSGYNYYEEGYRTCESSRWVWDPYIQRRVLVRSRYAC